MTTHPSNDDDGSGNKDSFHFVFVYGSLRKGHGNNALLRGTESIGVAGVTSPTFITEKYFRMTPYGSHGGFPAVWKATKEPLTGLDKMSMRRKFAPIKGEVYKVNNQNMSLLDRLEGHPSWYKRELKRIVGLKEVAPESLGFAWVYIMGEEFITTNSRFTSFESLLDDKGVYDWNLNVPKRSYGGGAYF